MTSFKRARSPPPFDASPSSSQPSSPTIKAARTSATPPPHGPSTSATAGGTTSGPILCTLPPTCNPPHRPTTLADTRDLEAHYARYHAHVCEQRGCGCVFPDARLLELHQTECHDPLAAVRKERGEKIFACHLPSCSRKFSTPKTRRMHLIEAHGYPKEYFFAVTNKGVGGLLKRWGEGASLLRKPWKARENGTTENSDEDGEGEDEHAVEMEQIPEEPNADVNSASEGFDDDDDDDEILLEKIQIPAREPTAAGPPREKVRKDRGKGKGKGKARDEPADVDELAGEMNSLSLVPTSIQFGRGAKRGALQSMRGGGGQGHAQRGRAGRGADVAPMEVDVGQGANHGRGRGGLPRFPRGGALRAMSRGRGLRGALGIGQGRGTGPGRGVGKNSVKP